eukprot:SAG22_NODE_3756_length_1543_cov_6.406510_2_plen_333_part_00
MCSIKLYIITQEKVIEVQDKAVEIVAGLADGDTDEDEEVLPIAFKPVDPTGPRIKLAAAAGGGQPKAVRNGVTSTKQSKGDVEGALNRWKKLLGDAMKKGDWDAMPEIAGNIKRYEGMLAEMKKVKKKTTEEMTVELKMMNEKHEELLDEMGSLKAERDRLRDECERHKARVGEMEEISQNQARTLGDIRERMEQMTMPLNMIAGHFDCKMVMRRWRLRRTAWCGRADARLTTTCWPSWTTRSRRRLGPWTRGWRTMGVPQGRWRRSRQRLALVGRWRRSRQRLALVVGWLGAGVVPLLRLGRLGAGVVPLLRPVWLGCLAQVGVVPRSLTC